MSWDFAVDDLRKELKELKEKLAVQGVKVGEQESKLLKNEEQLKITKGSYVDAMDKLRKEADHTLHLEEALRRRNEELRNERNTRENVEKALRTANEEREREAASAKEAQHVLNQMASDSNEYREEREKLAAVKAKLDAQVRELQGELRRHETAPLPPPKTPARPRASSLTNLNKVAMLERDIVQVRASASASEIDLKAMQEKLSRAHSDLVRMENEKAAVEKRLKDSEQKVRHILADKDDLQAELDFYKEQSTSGSHEEELIARLEEEESKVALLEQQLAKACRSDALKCSVDQLQVRLNNEISQRQTIEACESLLVQEREEALNELEGLKMTMQELNLSITNKDTRIKEFEILERSLQEQLKATRTDAAPNSVGIDEEKITEMVNGIARIRAERDELNAHLEFVQMESHFKVEALEKKLAEQTASTLDGSLLQDYQSRIAQLTSKVNIGNAHIQQLCTATSAILVTIQQLHAQNECLREQVVAPSQEETTPRMEPDLTACCSGQDQHFINGSSLDSVVSSLQENLRMKIEETEHTYAEHQAALACKDEEIAELHVHLSDNIVAIREDKEIRATLEKQLRELEVALDMVKQELVDTLENCEHLDARQPSDAATISLKKEIEELRSRVARRTEQIGLQQHDIKRLETNMRLTDERLEEVLGELEMAETAKVAMLEDCSTAREERDQAKKALLQAELEVERLTTQVRGVEMEKCELRDTLATMDKREKQVYVAKHDELLAAASSIAERDSRIEVLTENLKASEAALRGARELASSLQTEIREVQEASKQSMEELQKRTQADKDTASEGLERQANELRLINREVEASKHALTDAEGSLRVKSEEYERAMKEVEELTAKLEATRRMERENSDALQPDTRMALSAKEEELRQKADELQRLSFKFKAAKASEDESSRMLQSKQKELYDCSTEVDRLTSELEKRDANRREFATTLEIKEKQLVQTSEQVARLETEKAELLTRLAAFETDSEKELTDSASLRSVLEEERKQHEQVIRALEANITSLRIEKDEQLKASNSVTQELRVRHEEATALLEATKVELGEKQELYDALVDEQRKATACHEAEAADLKAQLASLSAGIETLQKSLQEEVDGQKCQLAALEEELRIAQDKQGSLSAVESELRHEVQQYQDQLAEVRVSLLSLQDENTTLQAEMDNMSGECHRANLKSQSLDRQLASNGRGLSELRDELSRVREALSQSEKSGKTAEMNLLLISQQNERTISSLRNQLKEHEKDAERIQKLQQIVGETREQISEMEGLLRTKCAEIEENDDKFIQLLKEKKKLTSKVESLTKKNNNLQSKLATASVVPSKVAPPTSQDSARRSSPSERNQLSPVFAAPTAPTLPETHTFSSTRPRLSVRPVPLESRAPEHSRRISGSKRRRESTPPLDEIPVTTSIGKKRPLPDDYDAGRPSVEARFPDSYQSTSGRSSTPPMPSTPAAYEFTSTPHHRRTALRSGFTPVRGQTTLRPTLSQPSPVRKSSAAHALQASTVISDVTNSPPRSKRAFMADNSSNEPRTQKPAGKGWLGKIRGGTNHITRTRHQSNTDTHP